MYDFCRPLSSDDSKLDCSNNQIFIGHLFFRSPVGINANPLLINKLFMVFILNVFSHLFHNWVVVGVFLFLELDSSHWLYLDNLFTLILSLLIVNRLTTFQIRESEYQAAMYSLAFLNQVYSFNLVSNCSSQDGSFFAF